MVPLQVRRFGANSWPGGHSHLKLPGVLMHLPPRQRPGVRAHSSISVKAIGWQFIIDWWLSPPFVRSFKVDTQSVPANLVDLFSQLNKSWFNIFTFLNLIMWQSGFDPNGRQQLDKIRNHFEVVWRFLGLFQHNWQEIESVLNQFEGDFKRA